MKAKAAPRPFVTKSIRAMRAKGSSHASLDPQSRARPFLVQALRLRQRKPPRS